VPGYLLDTNHFSAWERGDQRIIDRVATKSPESFIWLCPIVLGEIEFGLQSAEVKDQDKQKKCRAFINAAKDHVFQDMEVHTGLKYGSILSRIYEKHAKVNQKDSTQEHLTSLKVDVNDVWFAAIALTQNLILVTDDAMDVIQECVPELRVENWLV
jgi:predicted nucleic acid-binding protein